MESESEAGMFSASTSMVNEVSNVIRGWLKNPLNQSFVFWYFLPAAGFILLQLLIVGPLLGFQTPLWLTGRLELLEDLGSLSTAQQVITLVLSMLGPLVLGPFILAIVLGTLSNLILQLFQGTLPFEQYLLGVWLARNRRRSAALYGELARMRREYVTLTTQRLAQVGADDHAPSPEAQALDERLAQLIQEIHALHDQHEDQYPVQTVPSALERVAPTALGNAMALAEEYPFERYGVDAVLFWPRLRAEIEPDKLEPLDTAFGAMTGLLNVALLSYVFMLEAVILWLARLTQPTGRWVLPLVAVVTLMIGSASYYTAVSAARAVSNIIKTFFDYDRGRVLERFNLRMPESIDEERLLWLGLAAFVRRGESFYFPSRWRKSTA